MIKENIVELIKELDCLHKRRKKVRRCLCKFIRKNIKKFIYNGWLERKVRLNYLGDLSDRHLQKYCLRIYRCIIGEEEDIENC